MTELEYGSVVQGLEFHLLGENCSVWIWGIFYRYWISLLSLQLFMSTVQDWALQLAFYFYTSRQAFVLDHYNAY
jgi:hypothetical protein